MAMMILCVKIITMIAINALPPSSLSRKYTDSNYHDHDVVQTLQGNRQHTRANEFNIEQNKLQQHSNITIQN